MIDPRKKLFRWGPISACPLFMYFTIEPAFAPLKKLLGMCFPNSVIVFKDNKVTWFLDDREFSEQSRKFADKVIFDQESKQNYFRLWNLRTELLLKSFKQLDKIDFKSLGDKDLKIKFKEFSKIYYDWWTLTISLELVTVTLEPLMGRRLKPYFPDENPKEYNQAFSVLTSPLALTFYRQEQLDLLKIFALHKENQNEAMKEHQQKFYWIYNSYLEGKVLDVEYFQRELKKISAKDYQDAISEIENYSISIVKEKKGIIEKINPTEKLLELISLVETFSQLQDERKENNFKAEHYLELLVKELSRRTGENSGDLKMLLSHELLESFKFIDQNIINERKECFVLVYSDKGIDGFVGEKALMIANNFTGVKDIKQTVIHGILASTGQSTYFRGIARVVLNINEIGKVGEGEILVTTMTSPDFVIGMKRAGAIITDVGGILCHAAIVSREFKKPCIVGTQIATKVIHDGDVVELHCGRGTVKIIKTAG